MMERRTEQTHMHREKWSPEISKVNEEERGIVGEWGVVGSL